MFRTLRSFAGAVRAGLSMPVLVKELTETAARRRTYVLRVVYALALYGIFLLTLPELSAYIRYSTGVHSALLGFGRRIFEQLCIIQVFGIILFQPALMCGRITQEKERDSLVLLFLTEVRPWEIVLQKYIGGLVPMLSFLLLGLPLAGIAYALGGLESRELAADSLGLLLLTLQIGALALLCSAWCRSTVGALLSTYLLGVAFYAGPPLLGALLISMQRDHLGVSNPFSYDIERLRFLLIPIAALSMVPQVAVPKFVLLSPSILSIALFLFLARRYLIRRAFVPPSNYLPRLFARIDGFMKRANRLTGGIVLYRDAGSLPGDDPIFWRETQRRVLGKPHYLFRLLCVVEIPTVLICMGIALGDAFQVGTGSLSLMVAVLGALAVYGLSATAANGLVSERVGQTLEVLLTTRLSARDIIRQKERALRRLEWILAVPLLTVCACEALLDVRSFQPGRVHATGWLPYLTCAILLVAIYLPMVTWLSLWIGLRVRTRFQAILTALGALTAWMGISLLMATLPYSYSKPWFIWMSLASPLSVAAGNELGVLGEFGPHGWWKIPSPWPVILVNAALYAALALFIRARLFADADRCFRR